MSLLDVSGDPIKASQQKQIIQCCKCQQPVALYIPQMQVVNTLTISGLMFSHEEPQMCKGCGQQYLFKIGGYQPPQADGSGGILIVFVPIVPKPVEAASRIITMPGGVV